MSYSEIPITERTRKIKEIYLSMPVPGHADSDKKRKYKNFCTGDRWITLGYLRGWQKHANAETTLLRSAYAEAEELYQAEPVITEDELLVGHLYLPEYTAQEQEEYDKLCEMFQMSSHTLIARSPRKDHLSLNLDKLLKLGINGIKAEIEEKISALNLNDVNAYPEYEVVRKYEFYRCLLIELDAVLDSARRYSEKAAEMAKSAKEPRKTELLNISRMMKKVPASPAESFYEALQSVQFFLSGLFGLYPLNRPDRYLYEFYKKDVRSGALTREFAQELIDNFCLHVSTRVFSRAACGFIVGGQDKDGNLVENDLTYMFLTALDHLRLPDPSGALAVCQKTGDEILKYSAEILSKGTTHPAFYNDDVIVSSLVDNYGCEHEDAVNYIHTTCAEISVVGKSRAHTTPISVDMPRIFCEAASKRTDYENIGELLDAFIAELRDFLRARSLLYITRMLEVSRIGNEAMRVCALVDNCIEKGKSIYEGGEKYTFIQPNFLGYANVLDSLVAIDELVFCEKKLSLSEFNEIIENNFEGNEPLRQYIIKKIPHYGNDNERVDSLAKEFSEKLLSIFKGDLLGGKVMMPGTFSYLQHSLSGERMGATYDGRLKGYAYSDGCCPVQGRDVSGPTAMLRSLTSWEQSELLGGMVVNIKFGADNLKGAKADNFIALLKVFFARGGIEMQVNVVDRKTLEDARENPEAHSDLLVRIGGYSDYFTRLSPTLQQEIIDRTEN